MSVVAGIANALLLAIINTAAAAGSQGDVNFWYFALFIVSYTIFYISKRFALTQSTVIVERVITRIRIRLMDKVRSSSLLSLERLGSSEIYSRITEDTNTISQAAPVLINACQAAIMITFASLYIATLSKLAFVIVMVGNVAGLTIYLLQRRGIEEELRETAQKETEFFDYIGHFLKGFKELKVSRRKSNALHKELIALSEQAEALKIRTGIKFVTEFIYSQLFFYMLIAVIVFILPKLNPAYVGVVIKTTATILFIIGPIDNLVGAFPVFAKANIAIGNIYKLEGKLEQYEEDIPAEGVTKIRCLPMKEDIRFSEIIFSYLNDAGEPLFTVGPITMTAKRGSITFITGGNGSGKSTILKLLTGLYHPRSGSITVDGTPVTRATYPAFRELYSTIFSDFHLFGKLHGVPEPDEDKILELLRTMRIADKTDFVNDSFTNINLSTGQRKRLALVVGMIEDKEVYVFDEWAADQDPGFREYFYNTILKDLKGRGKTVIAVTHDDRYFHIADMVYKMEFGKLVNGNGDNAAKEEGNG